MQFPYANTHARPSAGLALGLVLSLGTGCPSDDTTDGVANETGSGTADEVGTDSSSTSSTTDTGTTTDTSTTESTTESTTDTGTDTTTDTGTDTTTDTGTDTTTDTTTTDTGMTDPVTIYAIQDGTVPTNSDVEVIGVWVTAIRSNGFFAQETPGGQNSGVYVYVSAMGPDISGLAIGDVVDITGLATEFGGLTEIDAAAGTVIETGSIAPILPDVITSADLVSNVAEPWESVYVRIEGDIAVSALPGGDEFQITDPDGNAIIDNYLYNLIVNGGPDFPNFGIDATFTAIQGIVNVNADVFKLAPRFASDLEGYMESANPVLGVDDLSAGDLVITEIMYDPNKNNCTEPGCEWIEVYNGSGSTVDLLGLRIQDSQLSMAAQGTIMTSVIVPAGGYAWLGHSAMGWPYVMQADGYMGNNPSFNNSGSDSAAILNTMGILDQTAPYATQGAADNGISWKLKGPGLPDSVANDMAGNWCWSTTVFDVDYGTPKAANEAGCNPNLP